MAREVRIALTPHPKPDKWLFLVGCYNSGTTLLAELLGRHPEITGLPTEGHFITDQFIKDYEIGVPRMWIERESVFRMTENDAGPDPVRIKREWAMRAGKIRTVFLEKSPPNSARTRWLAANFPNSYFVSIVRNGYAVAEGITRKGDPKHLDVGWPIDMSARMWARNNEVLLEDEPHLKHFKWVSYEDMCADTEGVLRDICEFVDLDPAAMQFDNAAVQIHERNESVRNMNGLSIDKLTREQIETVNAVAAPMLKHFGYEIL